MDLKDIRELVQMINSSELAYFELKMDDNYIKMDKSLTRSLVGKAPVENIVSKADINKNINSEIVNKNTDLDIEEKVLIKEEDNLLTITSPMVGTFYGSSSPDSSPFVSEGLKVSKGDALCIIEAMKLMNEIECEYNGEIVKILVEEGQMVEYGQPMFKIRRG
ncbi:acetyl-CoA carboxylase biotin carboxyl carrier protein [Clostridium gasigenes]|uniref:Biotin carboxyl carrier protein of acetyl-CoA carboxylase n=1 Tax=Clostridium gasigenes TaxID=94869 RepID=A0A7X0VS03_9CLOT|nr:acetyl-CoA carboxylase biotin carboxyl carrier protein [Clostridium gasigenes]MBB6715200.1 acetyl-CoA carboxylase biotin carboxyl carrier protein [Clostridium gasigenes]